MDLTPSVPLEESASPATTLLIVDDEAMIRESTIEFLARNGYKVLAAASGEEALDKLNSYKAQSISSSPILFCPK